MAPALRKNGNHATETVSYIVLEAGTWEVAGGKRLEVGKVSTNATVGGRVSNVWAQVTFSETFSSAPVVLSQVQSNDDSHWVKTRQRNPTTTGFQVAMEEEEAKTTAHGTETIGWLAIPSKPGLRDAGQGTWNGHAYPTPLALRDATQ